MSDVREVMERAGSGGIGCLRESVAPGPKSKPRGVPVPNTQTTRPREAAGSLGVAEATAR